MTAVTTLLAIIIAMLYLISGLLTFIITFLYDLNFDELFAEKRKYIKSNLVWLTILWPIVILILITRLIKIEE